MLKVVNIKSDDTVEITCGGQSVVASVDDATLPAGVQAALISLRNYIETNGLSQIHMEEDLFRTFTHRVNSGEVLFEQGISRPEFATIMSHQAELFGAE